MMEGYNCHLLLSVLFACTVIANAAELRCYDGSLDNYTVITFDNPLVLLNSTCYQSDRKTVIYAFGYRESPTSATTQDIIEAFLEKDVNFILLNWEKEAGGLQGVSYVATAVENADKIGKQLGQALIKLSNAGLSLSTVLPIGFSLGAQLWASAGNEVQTAKKILDVIIGLDAAGPLFEGVTITTKLKSTCAKFVEVLHTNPGVFGTYEAVATADIWFNCGSSIQPACDNDLIELATNSSFCSHVLAVTYFAEAVRNSTTFIARSATSCSAWKSEDGTDETISIGDDIDTNARGNYYCRTENEPPYGLSEEGSQPS